MSTTASTLVPELACIAAPRPGRIRVLGVPFDAISFAQTLDAIDGFIKQRQSALVLTANLNWAMLQDNDAKLAAMAERAALVVADGMPLVWASWLKGQPLPERVAGSDLLPALCERAAARGYRVYFLGAAPGVAQEAADKLIERYPGLQVAGIAAPHLAQLTPTEERELLAQIRDSGANIVFAAFGQPKGEEWLHEHLLELGPAVVIQIGASIDFIAGRAQRAPRWMQRTGSEWLYRLWREPKRMASRYGANAWFLLRRLVQI